MIKKYLITKQIIKINNIYINYLNKMNSV
jgi:hypothetical protein